MGCKNLQNKFLRYKVKPVYYSLQEMPANIIQIIKIKLMNYKIIAIANCKFRFEHRPKGFLAIPEEGISGCLHIGKKLQRL